MSISPYHRYSKTVTRTRRWARVRSLVLRRDGYKCIICGYRGELEVDHIKPVRDAPELSYVISNLQALCKSCHTRKTRIDLGQKTDPISVEGIRNRRQWRSLVSDLEAPHKQNRKPLNA